MPKTGAAPIIRGIVSEPSDPNNVIEIVHSNPSALKKIVALFNSYSADEMVWCFRPTAITISAQDLDRKVNISCEIKVDLLVQYYCSPDYLGSATGEMTRCVQTKSFNEMLKHVDKGCDLIRMYLTMQDNSSLFYVIVNKQGIEKCYERKITVNTRPAARTIAGEYPLQFALDSKLLKQTIGEISKVAGSFQIRKEEPDDNPLSFEFVNETQESTAIDFRDARAIALRANLAPNEHFSVVVRVAYIKHFATSCIGDRVYVRADRKQPLCLMSFVDGRDVQSGGAMTHDHVFCIRVEIEV